MSALGLLVFLVLLVIALIALCVHTYLTVNRLVNSQAKLSFVIREDAKRYFDDAAAKIVETNSQFRSSYVDIVQDGTSSALNQAAQSIEGSIVAAQREANQIILRARDDARRINVEARKMAIDEMSRSIENAADTIAWVMERYVQESFSTEEHREVIDRLVDEYVNEYRH